MGTTSHKVQTSYRGQCRIKWEDNAVQVIPYKNRKNRGYIAEKTEHHIDEEFSILPVVYVGAVNKKPCI